MAYDKEKKKIINTPEELAEIITQQLDEVKDEHIGVRLYLTSLEITFLFRYDLHIENVFKENGYVIEEKTFFQDKTTEQVHIKKDDAGIDKKFKISIDFSKTVFKYRAGFVAAVFSGRAVFFGATFLSDVNFSEANFLGPAYFWQATFSEDVSFMKTTFLDIIEFNHVIFLDKVAFISTTFSKSVDFWGATFEKESNFRGCRFFKEPRFTNTKFEDTVIFLEAEFKEDTVFYQTYFKGATIFSQAIFKGHALFIYSVISNALVLQGVTFEQNKGLDLASATITGTVNPFGFSLQGYTTSDKTNLSEYYKAINTKLDSVDGENITIEAIPTHIKRETFRILKEACEKQSNIVESLEFKKLEKETLFKETLENASKGFFPFLKALPNLLVLSLNAISNWFGSSYFLAFFFTIGVGLLFFNLSLLYTIKLNYAFSFNIEHGVKDFLSFMNPTHGFDYIGLAENNLTTGFYVFDFLGRIFVGYGIYQFIRAFRKL